MVFIKYVLLFLWSILSIPAVSLDILYYDIISEPKYQFLKKVGNGAYGVVFQEDDYVIKVARFGELGDDAKTVLEIALFKALKHKSIPDILGINIHKGKEKNYWELRLPYYRQPDKNNLIEITKDMSSVLAYAHAHNIAHRDIKNVHIVDHNGVAVLIDWGSADILAASPGHQVSTTVTHRDPALLLGETGSPKANDLWSLGVSLLEINNKEKALFWGTCPIVVLGRIFSPWPYFSTFDDLLNEWQKGNLQFTPVLADNFSKLSPEVIILKDLFNIDSNTRLTAHQLSEKLGNNKKEEVLKFPPTPKTLIFKENTINNTIRRQAYLWLNSINSKQDNNEKILFEAMSITDRFIEKSAEKMRENLYLPAAIAYYLSSGFYDRNISIPNLVKYAVNSFTEEQFKQGMAQFLQDADYNIIYNHMLRDLQNELYKNMSIDKNRQAILMLEMLEIDEQTFAYSNEKKWDLVQRVINDNKSDEARAIMHHLCTSFKKSHSFVNTSEFKALCAQVYSA